MKKKTLFIVSHTHWDREWYLRKEEFLMMLIDLVDRLIEILENDPDFSVFMLDGQTIALEDYLSVRPDRRNCIRKFIEDKRILIGPWYVLPDEYLISGEGHIRNYMIGKAFCREMGNQMNIGYLPDSFGHPSQMPQILKGLGLNEIVFWRGLNADITETELQWTGLDGTEILGINLPFGYGIGACLPQNSADFIERVRLVIQKLTPLTRTNSLLMMQGVDHVAPMYNLPKLLEHSRKEICDVEIVHGSLEEYLESLPEAHEYQKICGELRSGYKAYLLGGTISTRMQLKQECFKRESELSRYAEPLSSLVSAFTKTPYSRDMIYRAWKLYLQNMPHDSICGCSIDSVHEEMQIRFSDLGAVSSYVLNHCFSAVGVILRRPDGDFDGYIAVFNPEPYVRSRDIVILVLNYEQKLLRKVNYVTGELEENCPELLEPEPEGVTLYNDIGEEFIGRITGSEEADDMLLSLDTQPEMYRTRKYTVEVPVTETPAIGIAVYGYKWNFAVIAEKGGHTNRIENEEYVIEAQNGQGSIYLYNKRTYGGTKTRLTFIDSGDAGDEYTYSAPVVDSETAWIIENVDVTYSPISSTLVLKGYLDIPKELSEDRKSRLTEVSRCPLVTEITLYNGISRIQVNTKFENQVADHRLRAILHIGISASEIHAEGLFGVDSRPVGDSEKQGYEEWVEPPSTYPHKTFAAVSDNRQNCCLANRGLPEYEAWKDCEGETVLALTLVRSVGWLSRYDLKARKGNGGWTLETPGAQCRGSHYFEFSIFTGFNKLDFAAAAMQAHAYAYPLIGRQIDADTYDLVGEEQSDVRERSSKLSFFEVTNPAIVLSACKKEEAGTDLLLRFYNTTPEKQTCSVLFGVPVKAVFETDLQEVAKGCINKLLDVHNGSSFFLEFSSWEIITVKVKLVSGIGN
ncbi:MAG: hypothetical protein HQ557_13520 [Bacteroidetes bacterium]|nr:hypothetical protein [Bacteroidota bacterium]